MATVDLSASADVDRAFIEFAAGEGERPFDYERAPLMRATLVRRGAREHTLLVVVNHLIADLQSVDILRDELLAHYRAFVDNASLTLPEQGMHFADFAHWERQRLHSDALEAHLAFWRTQLAGVSPLGRRDLPFAREVRSPQPAAASGERLGLDQPLTRDIKRVAGERSVTAFMVLFGSLAMLLHRYTGRSKIAMLANFANRNLPELARSVGWYAHGHLVSVDVAGAARFVDVVERVRDSLLAVHAHHEVPMSMIWAALADDVDAYRTRRNVFDLDVVLFDYRVAAQMPEAPRGLSVRGISLPARHAVAGLVISATDYDDHILLQLGYSVEAFAQDDMRRLLADWRDLLAAAVAPPVDAAVTGVPDSFLAGAAGEVAARA